MKTDTSDNEPKEKSPKTLEKQLFEQVPTSHAGDKVLRRRRKTRPLFSQLVDNLRKLVKNTGNK